jgi:hypothetical protein
MFAVLLAAVAFTGRERAHACGGGGGCEPNWLPGKRLEHEGCTAKTITAGYVSYAGGTLWRHHNAPYTKGPNSDEDCLQNADCSFTDFAEDSFTCSWKIQVNQSGTWVDVGPIQGDCTGANWDTTNYEPDREYRAKCGTNDTAGDGPYGDDPVRYRYSAGQMLWPPAVTGFHSVEAYCLPGGTLWIHYTWGSSCGDPEHLDKVTVREKVTYEPDWTGGGFHDESHAYANCFVGAAEDPFFEGVP